MLALAGQYRVADLEQVCEVATSHKAYQLRTLRTLVLSQRQAVCVPSRPFLKQHALIRDLSAHEQFVQDTSDKEV